MAFRGGTPRGANRQGQSQRETPLIKLVEQYLIKNKHLSFINLDNMGDTIRRNNFRYSRMRLPVFKEQLKKAYEIYSASATKAQDDFSGANIKLDNAPLTATTLQQMEGTYYQSDSESDEMMDDELSEVTPADILKDQGANQMKGLYSTPSTSANLNQSNEQSAPETSKDVLKQNQASEFLTNEAIIVTVNDKDKTDCVSISSGTDLSTPNLPDENKNSEGPSARSVNLQLANQLLVEDIESGSDLEIIEEVQLEKVNKSPAKSVIVNGVGNTSSPNPQSYYPGPSLTSQAPRTGNTFRNCPNPLLGQRSSQSPAAVKGVANGTNEFGKGSDNRSLKRKSNFKGDVESSGINEDFTRKRSKKEVAVIQNTGYALKDFAGSDKTVEEICRLLMHLKHPEIYKTIGVTPPRGFLLHGPPGTGKTLLANAIAGELQMPMLKVAGTELVSGISGESESNIRELFNQAVAVAPCIVFIDEIDSVTPRRENVHKEMERRIVAQFLSCIDDLVNKEKGSQVLLIGATNRIEAIDTALRRAGRFDREICLGIPDEKSREQILSVICRDLKIQEDLKIPALARLTPGYVGADLQALVREAAVQAVNRILLSGDGDVVNSHTSQIVENSAATQMEVDEEKAETGSETVHEISEEIAESAEEIAKADKVEHVQEGTTDDKKESECHLETDNENLKVDMRLNNPMRWIKEASPLTAEQLESLFVTIQDFKLALKTVQPSSKREGFATVPDTTWDDIGALRDIRDELQVSIMGPVKHAEAFNKLGLTTPAGVLLCGPPGCGKTLLAKAVANEAGINFISVKGPELLNMYVGESERAVRQCFLRARNSSPCVIFFDELDALCPRRSELADSGSGGRIVNQLLTEMDGMESRQGVFVMAATNRPDIIDPAVLRPGRLDKILFVNLPTSGDRLEILKAITKDSKRPLLASDVNLEEIANSPECEDYTGADLSALVREASVAAFRELVLNPINDSSVPCPDEELKVYNRHFLTAFKKTKPSVNKEDRIKYKLMAEKYSSIR